MANKINTIAGLFTITAYESITVTASVKPLVLYTNTAGEIAQRVLITVEDGQVRWRADGNDPSATEGHLLNPMDSLVLLGSDNIQNFRIIKKGTANGTIRVSFEF